MTAALIFVPVVAAWVALTAAASRPGWGYVGSPPSRIQAAVATATRTMRAFSVAFAQLSAAMGPATVAMKKLGRQLQPQGSRYGRA